MKPPSFGAVPSAFSPVRVPRRRASRTPTASSVEDKSIDISAIDAATSEASLRIDQSVQLDAILVRLARIERQIDLQEGRREFAFADQSAVRDVVTRAWAVLKGFGEAASFDVETAVEDHPELGGRVLVVTAVVDGDVPQYRRFRRDVLAGLIEATADLPRPELLFDVQRRSVTE